MPAEQTAEAPRVPEELRATPKLLELLEGLYDIDRKLTRRREQLAVLEEERDGLRKAIAKRLTPGFWRIGPFKVRRTIVVPAASIDAWSAIEEGAVAEAALRPYMRDRDSYERWTVRRQPRTRPSVQEA